MNEGLTGVGPTNFSLSIKVHRKNDKLKFVEHYESV
jgi:hypothetical protein